MPTKKKRLTQREKAERAAMKKRLQAEGVLPPDKPRLNRKKFARETWAEWEEFLKSDPIRAEVSLLRAVEFIAGPELPAVTPEQVGVYKALKLAVEYNKFRRKLEAEGRSKYTIGELADEVVLPIWKL
jgi:toxin-antitoxin system, toxin component, relE family